MSHLYTPDTHSLMENRMVIDSHWPQDSHEIDDFESNLNEARDYHLNHPEDFIQFVAENHVELLEPLVKSAMKPCCCESVSHAKMRSVTAELNKVFDTFIDLEMKGKLS